MAGQKGRLFLLKLGASGGGGTVAGLKGLTMTIGNESVDITNKDSNGWRTLLKGAGTKSLNVSANGIAETGATYETLKGYAEADSINTMQIAGPDGDAAEASFQITSFEESGAENDALTFSISLVSSGTVTYTQA